MSIDYVFTATKWKISFLAHRASFKQVDSRKEEERPSPPVCRDENYIIFLLKSLYLINYNNENDKICLKIFIDLLPIFVFKLPPF